MIVIADTSPLNDLILIEEVNALVDLYGQVIIPLAVREELTSKVPDLPIARIALREFLNSSVWGLQWCVVMYFWRASFFSLPASWTVRPEPFKGLRRYPHSQTSSALLISIQVH